MMNQRFFTTTAFLVFSAVGVAGCASPAPAGVTTTPVASPTVSVGAHPQAPTGVPEATALVWDQGSKDAALAVADQAMSLYARPTVPAAQWLAELKPLMTAQAAADYAYVDPAQIPISTHGTGELVIDEGNGYAASARFGTPDGTYVLALHRGGAGEAFKVVRFTPPAGTP